MLWNSEYEYAKCWVHDGIIVGVMTWVLLLMGVEQGMGMFFQPMVLLVTDQRLSESASLLNCEPWQLQLTNQQ
jgi:hypothetical protein